MMTNALASIGASGAAQWLVSLGARATVVLLLAATAVLALRRASASTRHATLALAAASLLALPFLQRAVPRWELAVLRPQVARPPSLTVNAMAERRAATVAESPILARASIRLEAASKSAPTVDSRMPAATTEGMPASVPSPARPWPVSLWLLLIWVAGVAGSLGRIGWANLVMGQKSRRAVAVEGTGWLRQLREASADLGLKRPVHLLMDPSVAVPVTFGYRQAAILLPADAETWPEDRRRAVLLHELAHVRRRDCLTQALALLVRALYWPNPLAWWVVARLRAEAERACDDAVLAAGRVTASEYAAHLLQAARDLTRAPRSLAVVAVVERSPLEARLLALFDPTLRRGVVGRRGLAMGTVLSLVVAGSLAGLQPVARALAAEAAAVARGDRKVRKPALAPRPAPVVAPATPGTPVAPAPTAVGASDAVTVAPPVSMSGEVVPPVAPDATAAVEVDLSSHGVGSGSSVVSIPMGRSEAEPWPAESAAPPGVPVIRISSELVQIDAVVTDKSGRQVTDLKPEDFEVYENGKRKVVSHIAYIRTGVGPISGAVDTIDPSGGTKEPRTMVFVYDDLGLSPPSATWARQLLLDFVEQGVAASDRVAIVRTSQRRGVTSNWGVTEFRAEAEALRYSPWSRTSYFDASESWGAVDANSWFYQMAYDAVGTLKATIDALRAIPGRKAVIFLSEGFATLPSHDTHGFLRDYTQRPLDALYDDLGVEAALNSMTDLANRASVVIYAIDPAGLTTNSIAQTSSGRTSVQSSGHVASAQAESQGLDPRSAPAQGAYPDAEKVVRLSRQDSLREIAHNTGGLAVTDNNDLNASLDRILEDHSGYYLLAYEPDASTFKGRATFHKLKVEVKRRGLGVRSRKGFYSVPDEVVAMSAPPME